MMSCLRLRLSFLLAFCLLWSAVLAAASAEQAAATAEPAVDPVAKVEKLAAKLTEAQVTTTAGPATVQLGEMASLKIQDHQYFIGKDSIERFYQLTENTPNGNEVGVLIAPNWMLYFDYDDVGYVKDDEKDQLDAAKLLKSLQEGQEAANEVRREQGWDEMKVQGWAAPPFYDAQTHNLKWATLLSSSSDNHKEFWINENIRLLGRSGLMNVTMVCERAIFEQAMKESDEFLAAHFSFVTGQTYAEFRQGDKLAAYGLTALVLGGGAAVAAKMGLFANLAAFLGKAWKLVIAGVVAIGAGLRKFFRGLSGKQ